MTQQKSPLCGLTTTTGKVQDSLTVELNRNVVQGLEECPATAHALLWHKSRLLRLVQVQPQDSVERDGHNRCNDGECSESPSPGTDVLLECLGGLWTSKCRDHVRRRGEGESDSSVPETGRINSDDNVRVDCAGGTDR
jgi:hypothetical protein